MDFAGLATAYVGSLDPCNLLVALLKPRDGLRLRVFPELLCPVSRPVIVP